MGIYSGSDFSDIFRGISNASTYSNTASSDTSLADASSKKASNLDDKSGITVALEDFTKLTKSYNSDGRSQVRYKDAKKSIFEGIFGSKSDNVFKTSAMRSELKENGAYTQSDVFSEDISSNGGLKYAKDGDDIYKAALNYAKADIGAIEKSYKSSDESADGGKKSKLNFAEINSYSDDADIMKELDLDGDGKYISAEEYACYTMVADGLFKFGDNKVGFNTTNCDGRITADEADLFKKANASELVKYAKQIYDENFSK